MTIKSAPSDLVVSGLRLVDYALELCGPETFKWKVGFGSDIRREILLNCVAVSCEPVLLARMAEWRGSKGELQFCGISSEIQEGGFPLDRMELYSPTHGHIGTLEMAG